jgi:hypothetical protein
MQHFTKGLLITAIGTMGLFGGSFQICAEEIAPAISEISRAPSCNDDAVRKMLVLFVVRDRGIKDPMLGQAHMRGERCEIRVSTDSGKDLGYIYYRAVGYKTAPVLRVDPLMNWPK